MHKIKLAVNRNSITKKMVVPMVLVLIFQAMVFSCTIFYGGTIRRLDQNAYDILNEQVINRKNDLENEMIQHWSNLGEGEQFVQSVARETLAAQSLTAAGLKGNLAAANEILDKSADKLLYLLRKQSVNGVFLVLCGADDVGFLPQAGEITRPGIHIRDLDANSNPDDTSDLLIERAPSLVAKRLGITLDNHWTPQFTFQAGQGLSAYAYYYDPITAAVQNPQMAYADLGVWSPPFSFCHDDIEVISYSVPLVSDDGVVYGVLGVELSVDYIKSLLPYDELAQDKDGAYILAVDTNGDSAFDANLSSGPAFTKMFGSESEISLTAPVTQNIYTINEKSSRSKAYGCVQYLKLYNSNAPFEGQKWALVGAVDAKKLLGFSASAKTSIFLALAISIGLGMLAVFVTAKVFTKPITALAAKVKTINPRLPVRFDKIHIAEIDELSSAIEQLSKNVAESASKLSQIIEMTSTSIGAFELDKKTEMVTYTQNFFKILGIFCPYSGGYISKSEFAVLMRPLEACIDHPKDTGHIFTYQLLDDRSQPYWVRINVIDEPGRMLGVIEDVTQETLEKKKLEYERDYDLLTNLLNRRAFYQTLTYKFENPSALGVGALVMFDLDNLKYINDTYGHDYGDQYICQAAKILKTTTPRHAVLSRMSGDEFYVFLYGYRTKSQIREILSDMVNGIKNSQFILPDRGDMRVRASAGVAWYPDDADNFKQLIHYADFAMYTVKNTSKGDIKEFSLKSYEKNAYLLKGREELNRLIDEALVTYHFQPVVDAATGAIFGYEALMRSGIEAIKTPLEILNLARTQSKLYQIERLTWFEALKAFSRCKNLPAGCKVFINSIANQSLTQRDIIELEALYAPYLSQIVVELTEEEKLSDELVKRKLGFVKQWNAGFALDDFGSGYNSEAMLLYLSPNFVKIDMSIVRNIDKDENRLEILKNLASYTKQRQIKIIAEGVETKEEMVTLIECGVEYLQGYYLGMPQKDPQPISGKVLNEIIEANGRWKN